MVWTVWERKLAYFILKEISRTEMEFYFFTEVKKGNSCIYDNCRVYLYDTCRNNRKSKMSKPKQQTPSEAELEILNVLWKKKKATVREVHEQLRLAKDVGYTTTLKQMQRMLDKGLILREDAEKAHLYAAILEEEAVKNTLVNRLLHGAFGGSAMKMVMHALGQTDTSPEEIQKLEAFLKDQKNKTNE